VAVEGVLLVELFGLAEELHAGLEVRLALHAHSLLLVLEFEGGFQVGFEEHFAFLT
jgi:hypothetical protein